MYVLVCTNMYSDNGPCLGERSSPTGPYVWVGYGEVEERAVAFGAGLSALGLDPGQESFLGIYSQNNTEVSDQTQPYYIASQSLFNLGQNDAHLVQN